MRALSSILALVSSGARMPANGTAAETDHLTELPVDTSGAQDSPPSPELLAAADDTTSRFVQLVPEANRAPDSLLSRGLQRLAARAQERVIAHAAPLIADRIGRRLGMPDEKPVFGRPDILRSHLALATNRDVLERLKSADPQFYWTTPDVAMAAGLFERGAYRELMEFAGTRARHFSACDAPRLRQVFTAARDQESQAVKAEWDTILSRVDFFSSAHAGLHHPVNNQFGVVAVRRGIRDCDAHLFDPKNQRRVEASPTRLEKMIRRLPHGAIMADFGGGYGMMAHEAHRLRPDLQIFVNDTSTPEDWYASTARHSELPTPATMRAGIQYLTGDASTTSLPDGKKAALLTAVSLSQYMPDAVALTAHLYNQLAIGGVLMMTYVRGVYDVDKPCDENNRVTRDMAADLRRQGLRVHVLADGHTLAIERVDRRRMEIAATLYDAPIVNVHLVTLGDSMSVSYYNPLYRAAENPQARFVKLV